MPEGGDPFRSYRRSSGALGTILFNDFDDSTYRTQVDINMYFEF